MSYRAKIIIFVFAIKIIALAVGYLMRGMGLHWFFPGIFFDGMGSCAGESAVVKADHSIMLIPS